MQNGSKAVFFFNQDLSVDPAATHIFDAVSRIYSLEETEILIDGKAALLNIDDRGNQFYFVRLDKDLSSDYARYLTFLNPHFSNFNVAAHVNWHEGHNAPDKILTVHTTGDVPTGTFGPANPRYVRNMLLALEDNRKAAGLEDFTTITEGTHWSGIPFGGTADLIPRFPVPLMDIEIGSSPESWANSKAAEVVARSLTRIFDFSDENGPICSLLCVGGVHMEPTYTEAVLQTRGPHQLAVSHILPNQWIVGGEYDGESGIDRLQSCVGTIAGGVNAVVFHDGLKGTYKAQLRVLADKLGVPLVKHRQLRQPEDLPIW